jgi:subtilisin family serine protease
MAFMILFYIALSIHFLSEKPQFSPKKLTMRISRIFPSVLAAVLLFSCSKVELTPDNLLLDIDAAANTGNQSSNAEFIPNELLVKFKKGTPENAKAKALGLLKASLKEHIHTAAMKRSGDDQGVLLLKVNENALDAIAKARGLGEIEYVEPNWIYQHQATSNDPYVTTSTVSSQLWGMYSTTATGGGKANQFGIGATTAWAANKLGSSSVYVGIIDEGYMFSHSDLTANAGKNPGETASNGLDDDGNGLVDDVYGWDFAGNNNTVFDGVGDDHGTHVAGTIGGVGGNGAGVAGVVWNVKMLNAKFLGSTGGTTANAIKAVDYFTSLKNKGLNIVATNNSWGGGGFSQALMDAIIRANAADLLFIAAAGNSGTNNDVTASYPSNYDVPNVIAVAAIASNGTLASFSQYGATTVDIGAPGVAIWSTVPKSSKGKVVASYASYNGTSMATPHVTGAAALYKSLNPSATAAQIKAAILNAAIPTASLSGKTFTGGRLNVSGF